MNGRVLSFLSILVCLISITAGQSRVQVAEGVVLSQPGNNVDIKFSGEQNFSGIGVYNSHTQFSGVNFSLIPSGSSEAVVELSYFNATPPSEEKFAGFNVSSNASEALFSFSNLGTLGVYDVYANSKLFSRPNATGTGSISFTFDDWSENMFEIFAGETFTPDNVSITLTGNYDEVIADDASRIPGTYNGLDYPYSVMENSSKVEGIIATVSFKQLSYTERGEKDIISVRKGFDGGRFILPANTGTHQEIEEREQLVTQNRFLSSSLPSFTGDITDEHTISIISDYDSINVSGDFVIDTGTFSAIKVESTSSSSFQDVISGGNTSVMIAGE